jgi:hypothetical protein
MNRKTKIIILLGLILILGVSALWLFNFASYNFWLANQNIPNRTDYEHRLYVFGAAFLGAAVAEITAVRQLFKVLCSSG